jgi:hypothetical protein
MNSAGGEVGKYGAFVEMQSGQYGKDMREAQKLYDRLAVTT